MQHVFIIGSKGIPGNYGGYETFVDKLTEYHQNEPYIRYHVACAVDKAEDIKNFKYHNAHCFTILRISSFPCGSSIAVGSSSTIIFVPILKTPAIVILCF